MEFHMMNIIYAALPTHAQTEKTTFSCKDDCTLTKHTGPCTYSARDFEIPLCHTPPLRSFLRIHLPFSKYQFVFSYCKFLLPYFVLIVGWMVLTQLWASLAPFVKILFCLVDLILPCLFPFGPVWPRPAGLTRNGPVWPWLAFFVQFGPISSCLDHFSFIWHSFKLICPSCPHLNHIGNIWPPLDSFVFSQFCPILLSCLNWPYLPQSHIYKTIGGLKNIIKCKRINLL